jgi:uncharacterized protein DUF2341
MRVLVLAVLAGCHAPDAFTCTADADCGADGTCEPTGFCAFADLNCPTHLRYDSTAGMQLGSQCVPPAAGWWNTDWPSRTRLSITAGTLDLPAGFQIGFARDLDTPPCSGPRDNARIVWRSAELDRVIDEISVDEWIWFRLQAPVTGNSTTTEYYLYCGNAAAPPAPADASNVFDFFDDFQGATLGPAWQSQHTVTVGAGRVTLGGAGVADSGILTTQSYPAGTATDYRMAIENPALDMAWGGFQADFQDMPPWIQWWTQTASNIRPDYASSASDPDQFLGANVPLDSVFHLYGVEYYGAASMYRRDGAIVEHHVHPTQVMPDHLGVRIHNMDGNYRVDVASVRVRQAVDPPPKVTIGAPESL